MRNIIIIGILLVIVASCSLERRVMRNESYVRELLGVPKKIIERHDSIVNNEVSSPDSGYIKAYFECNDSNKVLLKRIQTQNSKGSETQFIYNNGTLQYNWKTDSARIAKSIIDKYSRDTLITNQVDKPSTLDKLSKLEQKNASKTKAIWILSFVTAGLLMILAFIIFKK